MARKKKKSRWRIFITLLIVVTAILFGIGLYHAIVRSSRWQRFWYYGASHSAIYKAFGIPLPEPFTIHGIDVSKYQGYIDWERVKSMKIDSIHLVFAFIKATEGVTLRDRNFKQNWKEAGEAGMVRGAYHFFLPTVDGVEQANYFIEQVALKKGDLPPVLDVEQLYGVSPELMRKRLQDCLDVLEHHYGVRPILYTYANFYTQHFIDTFDDYPLWVAHYQQPDRPGIARPWHFWQHSESGRVNGIVTKVDFNVFSGDANAFQQLLIP